MLDQLSIKDLERVRRALNALSTAPLFTSASRYSIERDWASVVSFNEVNTSRVLAWLLDPNQGHGLGDYFLREVILYATQRNIAKGTDQIQPFQITGKRATSFIIETEVPISINGEQRRIDILATDPTEKISIIIERKAGAQETSNQLSAYLNWGESELSKKSGHTVLYMLSGEASWIDADSLPSPWTYIDDEWLVSALQNVITRKMASEEVIANLAQLKWSVFGEWEESASSFYYSLHEDTAALRAQLSSELEVLKQASILSGCRSETILNIPPGRLVTDFLTRTSGETLDILQFFSRHRATLLALSSYSLLDIIDIKLNSEFGGIFEYETAKNDGQDVFRISLTSSFIPITGNFWPFYLELKQSVTNSSPNSEYSTYLCIHRLEGEDEKFNLASQRLMSSAMNREIKFGSRRLIADQLNTYTGTIEPGRLDWLVDAAKWLFDTWKQTSTNSPRK
ncbi:PD-(D/E)XK nuclease family protein [Zoogloeaceae bacterium G21618-S1]|nr:PD-(D/E)XK nuclease family protein [Zoogloeaceae bacterium G21618-S1]